MREGLPNSVCEAMLCGCIPVGVRAGGIPIAIGDAGFIAEKREVKEIVEAIQKGLNSGDDLRLKARERVISKFSLNNRKVNLNNLISNHLSTSKT